jgi:hypothetical protein
MAVLLQSVDEAWRVYLEAAPPTQVHITTPAFDISTREHAPHKTVVWWGRWNKGCVCIWNS